MPSCRAEYMLLIIGCFLLCVSSCLNPHKIKKLDIKMDGEEISVHAVIKCQGGYVPVVFDGRSKGVKRSMSTIMNNHFKQLSEFCDSIGAKFSFQCNLDTTEITADYKSNRLRIFQKFLTYVQATSYDVEAIAGTNFDTVYFVTTIPVKFFEDSAALSLELPADYKMVEPVEDTKYFSVVRLSDDKYLFTKEIEEQQGKQTFRVFYQHLPERSLPFWKRPSTWLFIFAAIGAIASFVFIVRRIYN